MQEQTVPESIYTRTCSTCGHTINDHDANECWARKDWKQCGCGWMVIGNE